MTRLRCRTSGLALVAAGTLAAASGVVGGLRVASAAPPGPNLGSWSLTATAPGVEFTEDEPAAQAHPEGQGAVPETSTVLGAGPVGYALSTVAWPGSYGGNAGSLLLVATPSSVGGAVPVPDAVHQVESQYGPLLNYPIRAEAHTGAQPDASYSALPGTTITAHADASRVEGLAALQGAEQPGLARYGNTRSSSLGVVNASTGKSVATSTVHDIRLGDVLAIRSVVSTATATTDGTSSTTGGGTVVSGLTIGGQSATIDETGLHVGPAGTPANAAANQAAQQALSGANMQVLLTKPQTTRSGPRASFTAGSLLVFWNPPGSSNTFTFSFGGARVAVASGLAFESNVPGTTIGAPGEASLPPAGGVSELPARSPGPASDLAALTASPVESPTTPRAPSRGSHPVTSIGRLVPTAAFHGIGVPWLVAALAGVGLLATGIKRLADDLVDRRPTCPLEP